MLLPYSKTFTGLKPRPQVREQITDRLVQLWRQYNPPTQPLTRLPPRRSLHLIYPYSTSHLWSPSFYLHCSSSSSRVSSRLLSVYSTGASGWIFKFSPFYVPSLCALKPFVAFIWLAHTHVLCATAQGFPSLVREELFFFFFFFLTDQIRWQETKRRQRTRQRVWLQEERSLETVLNTRRIWN